MASDMFLRLDGIHGESTTKGHKGEVDLLAWGWRVDHAATSGTGSGGGSGRARPGDLVVRHHYDKASVLLAKRCAQGQHIKDAVLSVRRPGSGAVDVLTLRLTSLTVTSVQVEADADGGLVESVSFDYAELEVTYRPLDAKGLPGPAVTLDWNLTTGVVT